MPEKNGKSADNHVAPKPVRPRDPKMIAFFDRSKQRLLELRDHFLDQMQSVAQDSLRSRARRITKPPPWASTRPMPVATRTKRISPSASFPRNRTRCTRSRKLSSASRVGTYGVCEMSNKVIPHARLEAIPFARFTVECQQQLEKENRGRRRWDTAPQFMDSAEAFCR